MQKAEIKAIADYPADFEEALAKVDNRTRPTPGHLIELEQVIEPSMTKHSKPKTKS